MSELSQWALDGCNRPPVEVKDLPSGLPYVLPSSSPQPDVKFEAPKAMDEPLNPFIPEANEPLVPDVTDEPLNPEARDGALDPHNPEATDAHIDHYIPAGVLRKLSRTHLYPDSEVALLEKHEWIRTRSLGDSNNVQVFVLPEAQQKKPILKKRGDSEKVVRSALKLVMSMIDSSSETWNGLVDACPGQPHSEEESLYYIFNTLQEPTLILDHVRDSHSRNAMEELLGNSVRGLKTTLYEFQRESAAVMVQREAEPALALDPRFQPWRGPTGLEFYYDKESGSILSYKILYPEACGGILAESMGCGKTLISLAVILATRGHFPKIPVEYQTLNNPIRFKTGTLMQMAAAAAGRFSLPWKDHFDRMLADGNDYSNCRKACVANSGSYIEPAKSKRQREASSYTRSANQILLCSGTLVIVPDNLLDHWEREIAIHTSDLNVLVLRNKDKTPSMDELLNFDIVLFSKGRCNKENPKPDKRGQKPDSPILNLHWLRVIVDEGHDLASTTTEMVDLLKKLKFERRWMISGTPLSELYGVELSVASQEMNTDDTESSPDEHAFLQPRKKAGNAVEHEIGNLDKLGFMVRNFLDLKPWSNNSYDCWKAHTRTVGEDGMPRKSPSLRATLQSLVVRHRYETVKKEITLPPLYNKVVYLEPTFYDRLYINIFLFTLAVNAITSEREGPDYMFDETNKKNKKKLTELIQNLRLAGFWWAGDDDVQSTVDIALEYLKGNQEKMTVADFNQLNNGIQIARKAMSSPGWNGFKRMHELGVFVRHFPEHARNMWALDTTDADQEPLLIGMTQARRAQEFVMHHLRTPDPAEGLAGEGIKVRRELAKHTQTASFAHSGGPESLNPPVNRPNSKKKKKNQTFEKKIFRTLPETSPLTQTKLEGVASAKLRYLLEQVLEFQNTDKIIIFYEHDNVAAWVEQGLELIAVKFRTYASTASMGSNLKSENLSEFRQAEEVRVLLMSVKEASHGLHIPEASRMYIVNPIWERNVESQAIKRAHRIGQKRPVYVETLVLGDTLEHRMLNRSKNMTAEETKHARKNPVDDKTMSEIIQNEPFLPMPDEASAGMAPLTHPLGLFDRHTLPIPDNEVVPARGPSRPRPARIPRRTLESDADSDSAVQGSPAKRSRIGFAEHDHGMAKRAVGAVPAPLHAVPVLNSAFGAGAPLSGPSRTGFAERVPVVGNIVGSVQYIPMRSGPDLPGDGIKRRDSLFGPFGP
ncbi:unnamed protein product [Penicillium egyptiacum]|uniref:Helicase C-terminal domain-containing protein n=1 Tax=Penicillium egyptiacum TaxID=1303716 RepID=A0A9W4P7T7_9EURO|nr:unnamed protein product [Penicillium egyptiacum]